MADTNEKTSAKKEKMVKFRPEFHPGVLEDDINISVNGKRYVFPRGKEQEVPEHIYKEFMRSCNAELRLHNNSEKMRFDDPVEKAKGKQEPGFSVLVG